MPDYKIHKPAQVTDENLDEVISAIYDAINRMSEHLANLTKES